MTAMTTVNCSSAVKKQVCFPSLTAANTWLATQNDIIITDIAVYTYAQTAWPVDNTAVSHMMIDCLHYPFAVNYRYRIDRVAVVGRHAADKIDTVKRIWKTRNPKKTVIKYIQRTTKRRLANAVLVKETLFVVYRR